MTALILALMTASATIPDELMLDAIASQQLIMEQMVEVTDALDRVEQLQRRILSDQWGPLAVDVAEVYWLELRRTPTEAEMSEWRERFYDAPLNRDQVLIALLDHPDRVGPLPQPEPEPVIKPAPQLKMSSLPRFLRTEEARAKEVEDMHTSGLTGLHLVLQTDAFDLDGPLDFRALGVRNSLDAETFGIITDLIGRLKPYDAHLHIWLWGDSDWHCNPIHLQGPFGPMERMLYAELNRLFAGVENLTLGAGWDCEEWLTQDHAQLMADALELPLSIRGLEFGQYNHIGDIPSMMHKRHSTEELEAFRAEYPSGLIITEDRCRQYVVTDTPVTGWRDPDRRFTREQQQQVFDDCVRLGIMGIFGRIVENGEDAGSLVFGQPFNYRETGWNP